MNKISTSILALVLSVSAFAQTSQDGFMLGTSRYAYKFNPALAGFDDFIGMVGASENVVTNVGASAFLYPTSDGKLVTALHSSIPASTFLGKLHKDNYLQGRFDLGLFSYGFKHGDAFHTIEMNIRGKAMASVPKSIFEMAKLGTSHSPFDLTPIQAQVFMFSEIAYGYTRKLGDFVTVGGRVKLLKGLAGADLDVTTLTLEMNSDAYTATYAGTLDLTTKMIQFLPEEVVEDKDKDVKKKKEHYLNPGAAIDLGIAIHPVEDMTISLSVLDLGGIYWKYKNAGYTSGSQSFEGLHLEYDELNGQDIVKALQDELDDFYESMDFQKVEKRKHFNPLPFQANFGIKYALPFHKRTTVGLTGSLSGQKPMSYWDARLGVSERFTDWLEVTASAGRDTFGMIFGFAGVVKFHKFRLSAGMRTNLSKTVPDSMIPIRPSAQSLNFGLTYDL